MNQQKPTKPGPDLTFEARDAVLQVVDLLSKELSHNVKLTHDGNGFFTDPGIEKENGILAISGKLADENIIIVKMALVRTDRTLRIDTGKLFSHLSTLGERVSLCQPVNEEEDQTTLWAEVKTRATPMSITRENVFLDQLARLKDLANLLQLEIPFSERHAELEKRYKDVNKVLKPIVPMRSDLIPRTREIESWIEEIEDLISSGTSVAIESDCEVTLDYALSTMAALASRQGETFGKYMQAGLDIKKLVELTKTAPGVVVMPAVCISMNSGVYDVANETKVMLNSLAAFRKPAVFIGKQAELQAVFSGGQGGGTDPLAPVVQHAPDVPIKNLIHFSIVSAGRQAGGISRISEKKMVDHLSELLSEHDPGEQKRLLPLMSRKAVNDLVKGKKAAKSQSRKFITRIGEMSETFGGLSPKPRVQRSPLVQESFTRLVRDRNFIGYFKKYLLAQDRALNQLGRRLTSEILTRPSHQPIRFCAEGTPATGKSEFCVLLARRLGVPYVNIDAASMPDYHMAETQLLGSGRGFVGSQQAGRLEQIAKHHTGAVVEVSDLDHAPPDVRAGLPDLFLQALETGEAQATSGTMFSCANLIFAFTMNLPGGRDEGVQKAIGFQKLPSTKSIQKDIVAEIKQLLSGAFLSRIGTPVFFRSLDGDALGIILEKAMRRAILSAANRLGINIKGVKLEDGLGQQVIRMIDVNIMAFGARALLEQGRSIAADAFLKLQHTSSNFEGQMLRLTVDKANQIELNV